MKSLKSAAALADLIAVVAKTHAEFARSNEALANRLFDRGVLTAVNELRGTPKGTAVPGGRTEWTVVFRDGSIYVPDCGPVRTCLSRTKVYASNPPRRQRPHPHRPTA
jgi:hypothetical protein